MTRAARILLFLCAAAIPAAAQTINVDFVRSIVAAPRSPRIAMIEGNSTVHLFDVSAAQPKRVLTLGSAVFDKHFEDAIVESLHWSADGHFLELELSDGDESTLALVLDVACKRESPVVVKAGRHDALTATWSVAGHRLYAIPAGEDLPAEENGVYVFDPETGKSTALARGLDVAGPLEAAEKRLWTRIAVSVDDAIRYRLISIDLDSGAVTRVAP